MSKLTKWQRKHIKELSLSVSAAVKYYRRKKAAKWRRIIKSWNL
jgi:hypothetical protein